MNVVLIFINIYFHRRHKKKKKNTTIIVALFLNSSALVNCTCMFIRTRISHDSQPPRGIRILFDFYGHVKMNVRFGGCFFFLPSTIVSRYRNPVAN